MEIFLLGTFTQEYHLDRIFLWVVFDKYHKYPFWIVLDNNIIFLTVDELIFDVTRLGNGD